MAVNRKKAGYFCYGELTGVWDTLKKCVTD
jgi:hypothetical protein